MAYWCEPEPGVSLLFGNGKKGGQDRKEGWHLLVFGTDAKMKTMR